MTVSTTPQLPFMFSAPARTQRLQDMSKPAQIRMGAEVLMRTLNAIAAGDDAGGVSRYITSDARFRTALSLAIPLSLCKPDVTSITVERSPKGGWDIYLWDRNGECDGGPAHATGTKKPRAIAKALMRAEHPVQIHWVR